MKVLLAIPHVFAPKEGSLYSSQTEAKRGLKQKALLKATIGNLNLHRRRHWIHASLGRNQPVVNRELASTDGVELTIRLFTPPDASLADDLPDDPGLERLDPGVSDYSQVPLVASRHLLEQADTYDLVGYMEDDLLLSDPEFFAKILYLDRCSDGGYAFLPHRCEQIPGQGDVILSGDPDGGRPDLFWDTGEMLSIPWPLGERHFYRATNPHSGCYFLSSRQAVKVLKYWTDHEWIAPFQLSGPLEQAGSGMLLPVLKIMKPIPAHFRFLMVRHQDQLWQRHAFERGATFS
ncbi:hypothetical protein [Synechococcus sp. MU1642]|uniref:hypothetical protein n=1 Tax=Synechococcus sp. MU1642 TaxID=2508348 RepID=UPI001CF8E439|nr:hypothetical protein [Synechococcus sp. MU1642]MCB4406949.1 hypothetical protein [Synechococcus sp. MU1642]